MDHYEYICNMISEISSIYIRVYKDNTLTELLSIFGSKRYTPFAKIPPSISTKHLISTQNISIFHENKFILGSVESSKTGNVFILGPVRTNELTEKDIAEISNKYGFPKLLQYDISSFLLSTPVFHIEKFVSLLSLFNYQINGEIKTVNEIIHNNQEISDIASDSEVYIDNLDADVSRPTGDYEETIIYCIRNGLVQEIKNISFPVHSFNVGQLGPTQMRSIKNGLIILNSICLRAAISGGLDTETGYALGEKYVQRIENAQTLKELQELSPMIRNDYCTRVHNLSIPQIANIHILKATEYVQNNIYSKITVSQIAEYLGIEPEYLSSLSKKNLGMTMSQYITKRKISEAKKLLRFTDKSLTEISNLLCFSSQSHFQRQFKNVRGLTPDVYRQKYRKDGMWIKQAKSGTPLI